MTGRSSFQIVFGASILIALCAGAAAQPKHVPAETTRLIEMLALGPRSTVADIGAGAGDVTVEIARQLGPNARVYSTDVNAGTLKALEALVRKEALPNVVVRPGEFEATGLTESCCDAVFVRHVYHHFGNPDAMNASIMRTLKPGGRLAVMDFAPSNPSAVPVPPSQRGSGETHGVTADVVVAELKRAGFTIVEIVRDWPGGLFMVLARK